MNDLHLTAMLANEHRTQLLREAAKSRRVRAAKATAHREPKTSVLRWVLARRRPDYGPYGDSLCKPWITRVSATSLDVAGRELGEHAKVSSSA
jgi:hypothetical protein